MYLTEKEIFSQYHALRQTYDYLLANAQQVRTLYEGHKHGASPLWDAVLATACVRLQRHPPSCA